MRKLLFLLLAVVLCLPLLSGCGEEAIEQGGSTTTSKICQHDWKRMENVNEYVAAEQCSQCEASRKYMDADSVSAPEGEKEIVLMQYRWDGYGVSEKTIPADTLSYAIIDCLSKLQETGEVIPKLSDCTVDELFDSIPGAEGTLWVECEGIGLFRITPDESGICKVQEHFGEGKGLQMTDTLVELLHYAWQMYPRDYWSGTYRDGEISLKQEYKANSAVDAVMIESVEMQYEPYCVETTIRLVMRSSEAKTVEVYYESYQSSDNLGINGAKEIGLRKGGDVTVEFTVNGFEYGYTVFISVDNTVINLRIYP